MKNDLTVRLRLIADLSRNYAVPESRIIDVGSDHGMLPVYCLKNGIFGRAVLTDINEAPAARSASAVADNCLSDRAEVICTDGLDGVELCRNDVVVMAGLGGNNIRDIIARLITRDGDILKDVTFILQPQKSIPELREYLAVSGFDIDDEECCFESGFYYCVLCVKYTGKPRGLTDREIYYGPVMLKKFGERREYKEFLDRVYGVRARGDKRIAKVLEEPYEQSNS